MGAAGYVKIHRRLAEHHLWTGERFTRGQAWVDLIMRASYQDHIAIEGNRTIPVKRGEVLTSQVALAARWGWDRETVRRFLRLLKSLNMAAIETSKETEAGYTRVTLLNYDPYQSGEPKALEDKSAIECPIGCPIESRIHAPSMPHYQEGKEGKEPSAPPGTGDVDGLFKTMVGGPEGAPASAGAASGNGRPPAPKRAPRRQAPPNPDVARLVNIYREAVKTKTGSYPVTNGMHARKAQDLLAGRPYDEAEWLVREWVDVPPAYYADKGMIGLEFLARAVPQLLARRAERAGRA